MKTAKSSPICIDGESLTFNEMEPIAAGAPLWMPPSVELKVSAAQKLVSSKLQEGRPIYGINTGFGSLANVTIDHKHLHILQENIIKSHAAGYGALLTRPETRLAMALRLNVLAKGYAGVRYALCQALYELICADIYPLIPEYGSVGASGDLAPLAHLALPLLGLGEVYYKGARIPAKQALKAAGLHPIKLVEKEGLALINGTQIMLAVGGLALAQAQKLLQRAHAIAALSYEALVGRTEALSPLIHAARGQRGQIEVAEAMRKELAGSYLFENSTQRTRVQDPYSLRCAPQVHGASVDAIAYATQIVQIELNAATDNPLIFAEEAVILSGGNFHGQPLALAFDFAAMALAELGSISERRLELLLNPQMNGLTPFLTPAEGLNSGYMALQYLSASLVNENKLQANPSCTDSIPGNAGIEDHVSMGMTSARKLKRITENVKIILSAELLAAAQAIDLRRVASHLGEGTLKSYTALRKHVPMLTDDRILHDDLQGAIAAFGTLF